MKNFLNKLEHIFFLFFIVLHRVRCIWVLLNNTNNSNQSFAHRLSFKQFYFTRKQDTNRYYNTGPERTREQWYWRGTLHSPKFHYYWSLTIKLFSVIFRPLVGGVSSLCRDAFGVFYSPVDYAANVFYSKRIYVCFKFTAKSYL